MGINDRLDAAESVFFERQLEHIYATTFDIRYPELKSRMFIPVSNAAPSGSVEVTYRQFDRVGRAKIIKPGATDAPRVDVLANEFTRPVRWGGASYGWNLIEIRQAQQTGVPLDARKAAAARRALEELVDEVAAIGAPDYGIATGFLNDAAITVEAATGEWDDPATTADEIIGDVQTMWLGITGDTEGVEAPNTLLVPDAQYAAMMTKPRSTVSDTTVLQFLRANFPGLSIEPWYRLKEAGVAAVDRAVLYNRSPQYLQQEIPNEFEQLPVFQRGSNFEVECLIATAGMAFYYPLSARYIDGV